MSWGTPELLFLLPPVGALLTLVWILAYYRGKTLDQLVPAATRSRMVRLRAASLLVLRRALATLGLILVAFSIARPQWGYSWRDIERRGLEIMFVLDTSNSMRANDLAPSRLQRAKWGIEEMVRALDGDAVGLVAFAGEAGLLCPLTLDYGAFLMHLDDAFPGVIARGGTNIEKALWRALESFGEEEGEADRVIVLVSDGEAHEGDLDPVIRALRGADVRVFAVGIGDPEGSLIPLPPEEGGGYLRNRQGEVVMTRLDEATLLRFTRQTNGLYVRASQQDFGSRQLIEQGLAPLKRAQLEGTRIRQMEERYQIFMGLGVFLLFLEGFARVPSLFAGKKGGERL